MDTIRQFVGSLNENERKQLLRELLIPVLKGLDGERSVADDANEVVGYVMSGDHRMTLIPAGIIDRFTNIDRSQCRPNSEVLRDLQARSGVEA